jgi:hypothetical protein
MRTIFSFLGERRRPHVPPPVAPLPRRTSRTWPAIALKAIPQLSISQRATDANVSLSIAAGKFIAGRDPSNERTRLNRDERRRFSRYDAMMEETTFVSNVRCLPASSVRGGCGPKDPPSISLLSRIIIRLIARPDGYRACRVTDIHVRSLCNADVT